MNKNYDIIGIGYCGLDHLCLLPKIPHDDKIQMEKHLIQGGGPCATAIFTASRLGAKTAFASVVGDDGKGANIIKELEKEGVDTSRIAIRSNSESAVSYCWAESSTGHRSVAWTKGDASPLKADELDEEFIKSTKILHLDGHQMDAALRAAEIAKLNGIKVFLDAGSLYPRMEELMTFCDVIIASEKFAGQLLGSDNPQEALKKIYSFGAEWCAVTLGNKGALGYDGKDFISQDSFNVDVVDTTGAGDVYHGAFVYRYSKGGDWSQCMKFASAVAAMKCTELGGRTGIPDLNAVQKFLEKK
jgi:ribokinase